MTFADLKAAVSALSPSQLDDVTAGTLVNRAYLNLLRRRFWMALRLSGVLTTRADKSVGTVSINFGHQQVGGSGTAFGQEDVGRYLFIGGQEPLRILSVTDASNLTLTDWWRLPDLVGSPYQIVSLRYPLPGAERIRNMRGMNWPMYRTSVEMINQFDPQRNQRGDAKFYAEAEVVNGVMEVELYPIPQIQGFYIITTRQAPPSLVNPTDSPIVAAEAVMYQAQAEACKAMHTRTGDYAWSQQAQVYQGNADTQYEYAARQDRTLNTTQSVAEDSDTLLSPSMSSLQGMRLANALSQRF